MSKSHLQVSDRKIAANRRNAQKSTGPKTLRGKSYSRTNALKHGLFAMDVFAGEGAKRENVQEYEQLLDKLWKCYQPEGAAEELEVTRIAACWWRLQRAWRYENSEIAFQHCGVDACIQNLFNPEVNDTPCVPYHAAVRLLKRAQEEVEATGGISDKLQKEFEDANSPFQMLLSVIAVTTKSGSEEAADQGSSENDRVTVDPKEVRNRQRSIQNAINFVYRELKSCVDATTTGSYDNQSVPKADVLDRLLRAEAAAERNLNRTVDRLERLQRRRTGEIIPAPISVRLSR